MAKRRRLAPATQGFSETTPAALETKSTLPPIARVSDEAAKAGAAEELANALVTARQGGRLIIDVPLEDIETNHYTRDRADLNTPEMDELIASINAHGQRMPVELVPTPKTQKPYGLLSGWRRVSALKALHDATGEARFATVQALLADPADEADAYVSMVEENEIRLGLSHYERARIALMAAEDGAFADADAAVEALYASGSAPKRSKIRKVVPVVRHLGSAVRHPQAIGERLSLRLADMLEADPRRAEICRHALYAVNAGGPEDEIRALEEVLRPAPQAAPPKVKKHGEVLPEIRMRSKYTRGRVTLTLEGKQVSPVLADEIAKILRESQ